MGKRLEELRKLDDTPIVERLVEAQDAPGTDLRETGWYQFIGLIDELIDGQQYAYAYETLAGIRETVERTRRVTEGQQRAVANIEASGGRSRWNTGFRGRLR